jgi:hypothetical protein
MKKLECYYFETSGDPSCNAVGTDRSFPNSKAQQTEPIIVTAVGTAETNDVGITPPLQSRAFVARRWKIELTVLCNFPFNKLIFKPSLVSCLGYGEL